jgi:MFS family permease
VPDGALGNAVVTANLQNLQGTFGAWSTEIAWLPAVYVMTNISINLLLVKFRQQYGLRAFTEGFLVLYVLVTFFHLFVNDLSSALMVRAAHGMVAAALSSLGIYYQIQAWPAKHRLKALTIGITGSSLAIPLARLFSPNCCSWTSGAGSISSSWAGADLPGLRDRLKTAAGRPAQGL